MEIWKNIEGYDENYQISNLGRVKRLAHVDWVCKNDGFYRTNPEIIMKLIPLKKGKYSRVSLYKNHKIYSRSVHRLVLCAFDRLPIKNEVAMHLDNDGTNNCITNLKWGTPKENSEQRNREGRNANVDGINNAMAKHSEEEIIHIKKLSKIDNLTVSEIAKKLNKRYHFIYEIVNDLRWSSIKIE